MFHHIIFEATSTLPTFNFGQFVMFVNFACVVANDWCKCVGDIYPVFSLYGKWIKF